MGILFMFIIPFLGLTLPAVITLGYFIESNILVGIIATSVFWFFSRSALAIWITFIASIIVPAVHGDFDLMLVSIVIIVIYLASPYLLGLISKDKE